MKINLILIFVAIFLVTIWIKSTNSYDNELVVLDDWKSIRELKENINKLDNYNDNLDNKLKDLNADYELKKFLKKDLSIIDLNKIRKITNTYNSEKSIVELRLYEKARNMLSVSEDRILLLETKRDLYNWLIPYIDKKYKIRYLEYIKSDAKIFNEQNNLTTNIISKKEILSSKVENIENKIKEHNDFINESIKKVIEDRLDEKINNLKLNESFIVLNTESKIKILNKTITKIENKIKEFKSVWVSNSWSILKVKSNLFNKKLSTYNVAIKKLEIFKNSLK